MTAKNQSLKEQHDLSTCFALEFEIDDLEIALRFYNYINALVPPENQITTNLRDWDISPLVEVLKQYDVKIGRKMELIPQSMALLTAGTNNVTEFAKIVKTSPIRQQTIKENLTSFFVTTKNQAHLLQLHIDINSLKTHQRPWLKTLSFQPLCTFQNKTLDETVNILKNGYRNIKISQNSAMSSCIPIDDPKNQITIATTPNSFLPET